MFRGLESPHEEVNHFYATHVADRNIFQLISNETTMVRILDAPGFRFGKDCDRLSSTASDSITTNGLAIMQEVLRIQATMRMNFKRILYFIPERGPLERCHEILRMELEQMVHYFGKSIFDCMVLIATVNPDVYQYIPPDVIPFSNNAEMKTRQKFQEALSYILAPGEQLPDPSLKLPIAFISMNDTCEDIYAKIECVPVIFDGVRLPFYYQTCTRCSLNTKVLPVFHNEKEVLRTACFSGEDPSQCCVPYDESQCHPVMIKKHSAIARIFRGLSHYISNKKNLEKWADPDDIVCAECGMPSGSRGCKKIGTFYEFHGKHTWVDHVTTDEPFVMAECLGPADGDISIEINNDSYFPIHVDGSHPQASYMHPQPLDEPSKADSSALHIPDLNEVEEKIPVSFLKREILRCGYNGLHYKDHDISIIIPEGSVALDREEIHIEVGITENGPFNFPRNLRLISPVIWLHIKEDKVLKMPFEVTVPHILNSLSDEKARYYQVCFYHSDHFSDYFGQLVCEFQPLISDRDNSVTCSFSDSYATVKMSKFCTLCITATVKPELASDIGYRLTTVVCTSQLRHEAYFCLSYDLGVYLQV